MRISKYRGMANYNWWMFLSHTWRSPPFRRWSSWSWPPASASSSQSLWTLNWYHLPPDEQPLWIWWEGGQFVIIYLMLLSDTDNLLSVWDNLLQLQLQLQLVTGDQKTVLFRQNGLLTTVAPGKHRPSGHLTTAIHVKFEHTKSLFNAQTHLQSHLLSVSGSVGDSFRCDAIASPSFVSLFKWEHLERWYWPSRYV